MLILKTQKDINNQILSFKKQGQTVGFVPTMGALHEGHLSLIRKSKRETDVTVCSIFVNPTQFNDKKDFDKYPITIEQDIELLSKVKCDILFLPDVKEMYPTGFQNADKINFGYLAETLEGEHRPGHFDGMVQIVERLLQAVTPDYLYMGQKDFQQAMICAAMIRERKLKVKLIVCPIKREKDGLAMSSRNVRLDAHSLKVAVEINKVLKAMKVKLNSSQSTIAAIENWGMEKLLVHKEFKVEYLAVRDALSLKPIREIKDGKQAVILVATWVGGVRLIDNFLVG